MQREQIPATRNPGRLTAPVLVALFAAGAAAAQAPAEGTAYTFKGQVIAAREAEVSARIDGRLAHINFMAGQVVRKGELLFEFDTKFRQIALDAARAKQKVAEEQLRLLEVKLQNAQALQRRNAASEMQLLEVRAERNVAAARVEEAEANTQAAQLQLDQTRLFAPIDGLVGRPLVREGAYLTLNALERNRLAVVTQLDPIRVVGEIPFDAYQERRQLFDSRQKLSETLEYTLILPNGTPYPHKGRLVAGSGEFNPSTQTMAVAVEFDNPEFLLRPGLAAALQSSVRAR